MGTGMARLLSVGVGLVAGFLGSALWCAIVPARGSPSGVAWLTWVRDVGLAEWPPANLGGIAACIVGTVIAARLLGIRKPRTILALMGVAVGSWMVIDVWLFMGLRIQDVIPDGTAG